MDKQLKNLILKSGNNLHTEVAQLLKDIDPKWNVEISTYYHDDITDKPREIDIIASKNIRINFSNKNFDFKIFLFIECKYLISNVAFRMRENSVISSREAIINQGFSVDILEKTNLANSHHYVSREKIGKLYDTEENKEIFNALTCTAKSLMFFKEHRNETGIFYPLVIYDGIPGIYEIEDNELSELDSLTPKESSIFHINYSYRSTVNDRLENQSFCIDFIRKNKLKEFIEMIEKNEVSQIIGLNSFLSNNRRTSPVNRDDFSV